MIGTQVRGMKHLCRMAKEAINGLHILAINRGREVSEYIVFPCEDGQAIALFSNYRHGRGGDGNIPKSHKKGVEAAQGKGFYFQTHIFMEQSLSQIGSVIIAVNDTIDADFNKFVVDNNKLIAPIFEKFIEREAPICKLIYCITDGNANFFAWAIKSIIKNYVSIYAIKHLMDFQSEHSNLVKETSKQNLIALSKNRDFTKAISEVFELRAKSVAKQALNWFNPMQKKMLREKLSSADAVQCLNNFSRLSKTKRLNFIKKVSTMANVDEILSLMSYLCTNTHFQWNKEDFLEFVKNADGLSCEVVLDRDSIVVLKVFNFETIKRLAKTTNWCISKNKSYWDNYMGHSSCSEMSFDGFNGSDDEKLFEDKYAKNFYDLLNSDQYKSSTTSSPIQFMVFDFNENEDTNESIVGITVKDGRIAHAHNFTNKNMIGQNHFDENVNRHFDIDNITEIWTSSALDDNEISDIDMFLKQKKINMSVFAMPTYERCNWDKQSIQHFILNFVPSEDINTLYESENHLMLYTKNTNMFAIFPNIAQLYDRVEVDFVDGYIFFLDFTKKENEENKILCWPISVSQFGIEEPYRYGFNEYFNRAHKFTSFMDSLSIPFNIIRRPNTENFRLKTYIKEFNIPKVLETLQAIKSKKISISTDNQVALRDFIFHVVTLRDITFIKEMHENFNICELLDEEHVSRLLINLIEHICIDFTNDPKSRTLITSDSLDGIIDSVHKFTSEFKEKHKNNRQREIHFKIQRIIRNVDACVHLHVVKMLIKQIVENNKDNAYMTILSALADGLTRTAYSFSVLQNPIIRDVICYILADIPNDKIEVDATNLTMKLFIVSKEEPFLTIVNELLDKVLSRNDLHMRDISRIVGNLEQAIVTVNSSPSFLVSLLTKVCETAFEKGFITEDIMERIVNNAVQGNKKRLKSTPF